MDDLQRPLPTIPIPPAQRWREVRLLYLPRIVFVLGVLVAAWMWSRWVTPATLVAEAEMAQAEVRSPQDGVIVELKVADFQAVEAGEVIGMVAPVEGRTLDATLELIRAEVGMLSTTMAGATDRQRVALEFERLQLEWMAARVELASLRGKLVHAEGELQRVEPLHRSGVMSDDEYALLKSTRDTLRDQVAEQDRLVKRLEPIFTSTEVADGQEAVLSAKSALSSSIKVAEARLKLAEAQLAPRPLVSPIRGVVSLLVRRQGEPAVARRQGEAVVAGEPILQVIATHPERLTGFLRQPLSLQPQPGMPVEIRTRAGKRISAQSRILHVGVGMETITPSLVAAMRLPPTPPPEPGLRIQIEIPAGLALRPGEFVDVVIP